jgi:hypothetical protein
MTVSNDILFCQALKKNGFLQDIIPSNKYVEYK